MKQCPARQRSLTQGATDIPPYTTPRDSDAVVLLELLEYAPVGDNDFEYTVNLLSSGPTTEFVARLERGNRKSRVTFRVTALRWPVGVDVRLEQNISTLVRNEETRSLRLPRWQEFSLASPITYNARGAGLLQYDASADDGALKVAVAGGRADSNVLYETWSISSPGS